MELFSIEAFVEMANKVLPESQQVTIRNLRKLIADGALSPALRQGRDAFYTKEHLDELINLRALMKQGFKVSAIEKLKKIASTSASINENESALGYCDLNPKSNSLEESSLLKTTSSKTTSLSAEERQNLALDFIKKTKEDNLICKSKSELPLTGLFSNINAQSAIVGNSLNNSLGKHVQAQSLGDLLNSASALYQKDLIENKSKGFSTIEMQKVEGGDGKLIKGNFVSIQTEIGSFVLQSNESQVLLCRSLSAEEKAKIIEKTINQLLKLI